MEEPGTLRFLKELETIRALARVRPERKAPVEDEDDTEAQVAEKADEAPEGSAEEKAAEARQAMVEQGATEAEVQSAEHSGALLAGGTDEDGEPAPTPGSEAAEQGENRDTDEKAVVADERDSEADEQRAVIDLQAPEDDKREAAENATGSEDDDYETVEDLKERAKEAGITGYSHMKRAELLAALAADAS